MWQKAHCDHLQVGQIADFLDPSIGIVVEIVHISVMDEHPIHSLAWQLSHMQLYIKELVSFLYLCGE